MTEPIQAKYSIEKPGTRQAVGKGGVMMDFDLNSTPYHIMLAAGPVDPTSHLIQQHINKGVTPLPVSLAQFNPFINASTSTTAATTTTAGPANDSSLYAGCYDTKGCFGTPPGCVEQRNCKFITTYSKV